MTLGGSAASLTHSPTAYRHFVVHNSQAVALTLPFPLPDRYAVQGITRVALSFYREGN